MINVKLLIIMSDYICFVLHYILKQFEEEFDCYIIHN